MPRMKVQKLVKRPSPALAGVALLLLASSAEGVTVDWDANPPEKILIEQCDDLVFNVVGTHNIVEFTKKNRYKQCTFDNTAKLMHDTVTDTAVTISGEKFVKRKQMYYGSDHDDDCNANNMKIKVEIIPTYDVYENQACAEGGSELKTLKNVNLDQCKTACVFKDDCIGFEHMPDDMMEAGGEGTCTLFDKVPAPGTKMDGPACYAGRTSCPASTYPACSMDMTMECTVNDGSGRDCSEVDFIVPPPTDPNVVVIGDPCQVQLRYAYKVDIKTTESITTTSMMRIRKGAEPVSFARPREYDWLNDGSFPPTVPAGVTASANSAEEVFVDFCVSGTYKTAIEGVAVSDNGDTVCTGKDQYKLVVKPN